MEPFVKLTGPVAPMDRINVDTDQIIPKEFLKRIERTGYGQFLFFDWRFDTDGLRRSDFILNSPLYDGASILVAGRNFGCGSSREHAPWALLDYGFRCVIAPSFADIFYNNCFQNGLLPVELPADVVGRLLAEALGNPGYELTVDLEAQRVWDDGERISATFDINPFRRHCMINGLDDIGLTLLHEADIGSFEARRGRHGGVVTR